MKTLTRRETSSSLTILLLSCSWLGGAAAEEEEIWKRKVYRENSLQLSLFLVKLEHVLRHFQNLQHGDDDNNQSMEIISFPGREGVLKEVLAKVLPRRVKQ